MRLDLILIVTGSPLENFMQGILNMLFFQLLNIGFNFTYKHQEDKVTQWTFYSSALVAVYHLSYQVSSLIVLNLMVFY